MTHPEVQAAARVIGAAVRESIADFDPDRLDARSPDLTERVLAFVLGD